MRTIRLNMLGVTILMLGLLSVVGAVPLYLLAQAACPMTQQYLPLSGYSVELDPNQIAYNREEPNDPDYGTRQHLLLKVIIATVGTPAIYSGRACEPNSPDPIRLRVSDGDLQLVDTAGNVWVVTPSDGWYPLGQGGHYRWQWVPAAPGVTYHRITARDDRSAWNLNDERQTDGTIVVVAIERNQPPILCGGLP